MFPMTVKDGVTVYVPYDTVRMANLSFVLSEVIFVLILGDKSLSVMK